jgi:hypothetical protein
MRPETPLAVENSVGELWARPNRQGVRDAWDGPRWGAGINDAQGVAEMDARERKEVVHCLAVHVPQGG